ncbi:MAG: MerR family transcriptional regulator, partial [Raoultibacter sp.]
HQRAINAQAEELQHAGMRPGAPNVKRFSAIDYDRENLWILFVDEPWRYGVVIEANAPHITQEAVVDTPLVESETFWVHPGEHEPLESLECLLRIDPNTGSSNAEALFTESTERGLQPSRILGTYLLSAVERADDPRWDYYHAWIL